MATLRGSAGPPAAASASSAAPPRTARRRREQRLRSLHRHVHWLLSLRQVASCHHTAGQSPGELPALRSEVALLRAELAALHDILASRGGSSSAANSNLDAGRHSQQKVMRADLAANDDCMDDKDVVMSQVAASSGGGAAEPDNYNSDSKSATQDHDVEHVCGLSAADALLPGGDALAEVPVL